MAGPGDKLQGADGATRASEINTAGRSTAGVRSVGAPQARSGMAQVLSCSRTVLRDALFEKLGTTDAGVGADRGSRCWLSLFHLPAPGSLHFSPCPFFRVLTAFPFFLAEPTGYRTT